MYIQQVHPILQEQRTYKIGVKINEYETDNCYFLFVCRVFFCSIHCISS